METTHPSGIDSVAMPPAMSPTSPIVLTSPGRPLVEWIIVGCYAYFFLIILLEVVMRYFFGYSTTWGEMTARYTHVYFAYLAAAEAFRHDSHIRVDYLPQRLRGRARLILEMYIDALCVLVAAAVCYYSLEVVAMQISAGFKMQGLPLNMAFATGAIPVGWGLMIIRIAQRLVRRYAHGGVNADVGGAE